MLVAAVFSSGWFPGTEQKCFIASAPRLRSEGWVITPHSPKVSDH